MKCPIRTRKALVDRIVELVDSGWEYPEAEWEAIQQYTGKAPKPGSLLALYDAQTREEPADPLAAALDACDGDLEL